MLGVVVALLVVGVLRDSGPRSQSDRVDGITKRIACPVCAGESVFESRNVASENIRRKVESLVAEGRLSDGEIISSIQADSNVQLLLVPRRSGLEAMAWALPAAVAVIAVAGLALAFVRWHRAAEVMPSDDDREMVERARRTRRAEDSA
jgi:cytochrome c-type biogenesis protein CcmH